MPLRFACGNLWAKEVTKFISASRWFFFFFLTKFLLLSSFLPNLYPHCIVCVYVLTRYLQVPCLCAVYTFCPVVKLFLKQRKGFFVLLHCLHCHTFWSLNIITTRSMFVFRAPVDSCWPLFDLKLFAFVFFLWRFYSIPEIMEYEYNFTLLTQALFVFNV